MKCRCGAAEFKSLTCPKCGVNEVIAMTPEERAVIEAAEELEKRLTEVGYLPIVELQCGAVAQAVRALRESRKAKPRWYLIAGDAISDGANILRMEKWERTGVLDDIMAALNEHTGSDQK